MENLLNNPPLKNHLSIIKNILNFKTKILVLQHSAVTTKFKIDKIVSVINLMIFSLDGNS
jgi:hypothetical protein